MRNAFADEITKLGAADPRVVLLSGDIGNKLFDGFKASSEERFYNCGVAEANMMGIGEAFAILGHQTWISTFCPFFDWKVLRRVAVGHQERLEAMAAPDGWLGEGHGLDLVMLATAANFETRTNGATHMGNDDNLVFDAIAHVQIVDISCPQQMLAFMRSVANMFVLGDPPDYTPPADQRLDARAAKLGITPLELAYDLLVSGDGREVA